MSYFHLFIGDQMGKNDVIITDYEMDTLLLALIFIVSYCVFMVMALSFFNEWICLREPKDFLYGIVTFSGILAGFAITAKSNLELKKHSRLKRLKSIKRNRLDMLLQVSVVTAVVAIVGFFKAIYLSSIYLGAVFSLCTVLLILMVDVTRNVD